MHRNRLSSGRSLSLHGPLQSAVERWQEIAARSFHRDILDGRQVWPTVHDAVRGSLWFLVGGTLIEVRAEPSDAGTLEVPVESPAQIAERCWDAGYTVRVPTDGTTGEVVVIDPFGQQIALVPRLSERSLGIEGS
ncbi:MAG TPA: hypothetical protein VJN70_05240 [Gemmatimonadaceae bacterium]|nr:hypothetical protein [Gemmatimonadaceae bacterium]